MCPERNANRIIFDTSSPASRGWGWGVGGWGWGWGWGWGGRVGWGGGRGRLVPQPVPQLPPHCQFNSLHTGLIWGYVWKGVLSFCHVKTARIVEIHSWWFSVEKYSEPRFYGTWKHEHGNAFHIAGSQNTRTHTPCTHTHTHTYHTSINTLRPRQNSRHFPDDIFKCIFLNENEWISIKISLKFVPKGQINNIPSLFQIMAWRRPGDKPLSEAMMVSLLTHICVTPPQWVKGLAHSFDVFFVVIFINLLCWTNSGRWFHKLWRLYDITVLGIWCLQDPVSISFCWLE